MKKTTLFLLLFSALLLHAEEYTITFNSGGNKDYTQATNKLEDIILTSSDNCVSGIRSAIKIYRAKEGYGIKGGTGSDKGMLTLQLGATYQITSMTLYAAAGNVGDTATNKGIKVYDQTIKWQTGHKMDLLPYTLTLNRSTDSISITALTTKNCRFYIHSIVFTADDPNPSMPKLTTPIAVDFGTAKIESGETVEDVADLQIIARNTSDSVQLRLKHGQFFSLGANRLAPVGGEANIAYRVNSQRYYYDTLYVTAINQSHTIVQTIPLKLYGLNYVPPVIPVDSSRMHFGAMPCNYYQPAQGLSDSLLKYTIGQIINCGARYRYGSGNNHTWAGFYYTDRDTMTNQVLDMYSRNICYFDTAKPTASVVNFDIEHMLPKSWWGGEDNNAYKDLFHLVPANFSANRSKSNHAPGIPEDSTFNNGSFITGSGMNQYGLTRVFCPEDEYKGDFARAYFYIVTCYDTLHWVTTGEAAIAMTNHDYHEFRPWLQDLLMSWHRMDPVSDKEKARAIAVNKIQGNRNPFIDYPELAEYIWGNKQGQAVDFTLLTQSFGDSYCGGATLINIAAEDEYLPRKILKDNHIVIVKDGEFFTLLGQ